MDYNISNYSSFSPSSGTESSVDNYMNGNSYEYGSSYAQQTSPETPTSISFPQHHYDDYKWRKSGGGKRLKDGTWTQHFCCTNSKLHKYNNTGRICEATMIQRAALDGTITVEIRGEHNHNPPINKPRSKSLENVVVQPMTSPLQSATTAVTPPSANVIQIDDDDGDVHHQRSMIINNSSPISPIQQTINNNNNNNNHRQQQQSLFIQPTTRDSNNKAILSIQTLKSFLNHNEEFCRSVSWNNGFYNLIFATDFQIQTLQENAHCLYVDGKFDLSEEDLQLSTIYVRTHDGISVPVVWMLHSTKTVHDYVQLFTKISFWIDQSNHYQQQSTFSSSNSSSSSVVKVVLYENQENVIREAIETVWEGKSALYAGLFRILQDNLAWIKSHQSHNRTYELISDLRSLWHCSKEDFDENVEQFLECWENRMSLYAQYFRENWLEHLTWAKLNDSIRLDNIIESWHNHFKKSCCPEKVNSSRLVSLLLDDAIHYERMLTNEHLRSQRVASLKENEKRSKKNKLEKDAQMHPTYTTTFPV